MRIDLVVPDRELARALEAVLDADGHEVRRGAAARARGSCDLLICVDPDHLAVSPARSRLLLRESPGFPAHREAESALRSVLDEGGTVVWDGPLRVATLRQVLGASPAQPHRSEPPALDAQHQDWLRLDAQRRRIVDASAGALARLALARRHLPSSFEDALLPSGLKRHVQDASAGARLLRDGARVRFAVWWTDTDDSRVLLIHDAPTGLSEGMASHVEVLAEVGRMAAVLAHEIRNPIASVAGALDLLRGEMTPEEREEVASLALDRLKDMRALLDDTLRMVRPLTGDAEPIDLRGLVDSVVSSVEMDERFATARIERDFCPEPLDVNGRLEGLRQALLNLMINGIESQQGSREPRLEIRTEREGHRAVLWVRDHGHGMPREVRERAFEPFYTTKSQGTGLGLAFVRRVVDTMYGTVTITDASPGTSFRLEFPLRG